ncbi:ammonium transporter [Phenylobacterium montanum]|uniref:Ammonium transporter n=1 Tax=Phenylobacterium montanum TaxID=2823693 RepID=A0A975FVA1_9CAUL|nr:ammonium transporter [Caulobacter sp. S6]QUD86128.1 ammonium transporter [Caulobacter sp. S6]
MRIRSVPAAAGVAAALGLAVPSGAWAASAGADHGDAAWVLAASALVLFMTLPGLALFYAGLVRGKNALSVMIHCVAIACLASLLWFAAGYSLAFDGDGGLIGGASRLFLAGVRRDGVVQGLPEGAYALFQMTFAVITPCLIVGAYVERIRFAAVLMFSGLWLLLVYAPVTHWVWGGGWLAQRGVMDFAGGLVVHATAGASALVMAVMLGRRRGFPKEMHPPHSPGMTLIGAGMLWVGWYGFNGGSALAANGSAAAAILATHLSASAAGLTWAALEKWRFERASMVGMVTGAVAGLATITPASGFVGPAAAAGLGVAGAVVCFFAVELVRNHLKIDDSLDVFAVHGVGGILGSILVAILAHPALGGVGYGKAHDLGGQLAVQVVGVASVVAWSAAASVALIWLTRLAVGLRASDEEIEDGLDLSYHGERAYNP